MKILLQARPSLYHDKGGDTIQITKYQHYCSSLVDHIEISTTPQPDLSAIDIVHCFNLQVVESTYPQIRHAKAQGKKVVFSPIYWPMKEFYDYRLQHARLWGNSRIKEELKRRFQTIYTCFKSGWNHSLPWSTIAQVLKGFLTHGKYGLQKKCLQLSDLILVSAPLEKHILLEGFPFLEENKIQVLPNGVDPMFFLPDASAFINHYHLKNFLLCVARMEPHKNITTLLQAVKDLPYPLVLIGTQHDQKYLAKCHELANERVHFLGYIPHDLLPSAYAAAHAHILPSWFDIPGLVSLEAGLAGCQIITTNRGSAKDYFQDKACYIDPNSIKSIKEAIHSAMTSKKSNHLAEDLLQNYTWDAIAKQLLTYYQGLTK